MKPIEPPAPAWREVTELNPCPFCGARGGCQLRDDGVRWCGTRTAFEGDRPVKVRGVLRDMGYVPISAMPGVFSEDNADPAEGWVGLLLSPCGGQPGEERPIVAAAGFPPAPTVLGDSPDPSEKAPTPPLSQREIDAEKYRRSMIRSALKIWERADGQPLDRVIGYLGARGIMVEEFPGGVLPEAIRFHGRVRDTVPDPLNPDGERSVEHPAMVARITQPVHTPSGPRRMHVGTHLTFLDHEGKDAKRDDSWGKQRKMMGACSGRGVLLSPEFFRGVMLIGEGLETTSSALVACRVDGVHQAGAMALLSRESIAAWKVPWHLLAPGGPVHTIVFCADFNRSKLNGKNRAAWVRSLLERVPHLTAGDVERIAALGVGERDCWARKLIIDSVCPWVTTLVRRPTYEVAPELVDGAARVEDESPAAGRKAVDWNDVLRTHGHAAVRLGVMGGIDVELNAARSRAWSGPVDRERLALESIDDVRREAGIERRASVGGGRGGDHGGDRGRGRGGGGGGTGGVGGGNTGGSGGAHECPGGEEPPDKLEADPKYVEFGKDDTRRVLPEEEQLVARMFLLEKWAPARGSRAGSCFHLASISGSGENRFRRFTGSAWDEMDVESLRAGLRSWLTPCCRERELKEETRHVRYETGDTKLNTIINAIGDEVHTTCREQRFWLRPRFDARGLPMWDVPAWETFATSGADVGRPQAIDVLAFKNWHLDGTAFRKGEVVAWRPTPLLYNATVFEHDLPIDDLRHAVKHGDLEGLADKHSPAFKRYRDTLPWRDDEHEFARLHLGYLQQMTVSRKYMNCVFLVGPKDTGKSLWMHVCTRAVGERNVQPSSFEDFGDKFHRASWIGKLLLTLAESEMGSKTDKRLATKVWQRLTGGDPITARDLYEREKSIRYFTRIVASCNTMPDMRDDGEAIMNRVRVIEFRRAPQTLDRSLYDRIAGEGLGVVLYGMLGQVELEGMDYVHQPQSSENSVRLFKGKTTAIDMFLDEWVDVTNQPDDFVSNAELHAAFNVCMELGPPDPKRRGDVINRLLTPLYSRGYASEAGQPRRTRLNDGGVEVEEHVRGYYGLRLTEHAFKRMADVQQQAPGAGWSRPSGGPVIPAPPIDDPLF